VPAAMTLTANPHDARNPVVAQGTKSTSPGRLARMTTIRATMRASNVTAVPPKHSVLSVKPDGFAFHHGHDAFLARLSVLRSAFAGGRVCQVVEKSERVIIRS
jgi:hypothetical protein